MSAVRRMADEFQLGHSFIGALICDPKWIDNEWASIPPETFAKVAELLAEDDTAQAGALLKDAFSKIAHRQAEHRFGIAL